MKKYILFTIILFIFFISCSDTESTNNGCVSGGCNNGICNLETNLCECENGYSGEYCNSCASGYTKIDGKCKIADNNMVFIPKGSYFTGCLIESDPYCESGTLYHPVEIDDFYIDRFEVTVEQYQECISNDICSEPVSNSVDKYCNFQSINKGEHPINCVTWEQADIYCRSKGKRLPTEFEWEKAARGIDGAIYPWGDSELSCDKAKFFSPKDGCNDKGTSKVGLYIDGISFFTVYDMAGNVSEWVDSYYDKNYYKTAPANNPTGPNSGTYKVVKGGGWNFIDSSTYRVNHHSYAYPSKSSPSIGFRCVK